ncbi:hypothetical protein phiOC_p284 [Ochrobactrum phage vB_OspM_OC]|nr:hypothetical protein phiOC_p284 [Ochrobactrum phage vB_OspM_OC]
MQKQFLVAASILKFIAYCNDETTYRNTGSS